MNQEKKVNKIIFEIENCADCCNSYTQPVYTADSFEHESGMYCKKCPEPESEKNRFGANGKHRVIVTDDWDLRKYSQIPDWCPLLNSGVIRFERN